MIRVTVEDTENGDKETEEIENDFIVICCGDYYVANEQHYPKSGTVQLTIKRGLQE